MKRHLEVNTGRAVLGLGYAAVLALLVRFNVTDAPFAVWMWWMVMLRGRLRLQFMAKALVVAALLLVWHIPWGVAAALFAIFVAGRWAEASLNRELAMRARRHEEKLPA